MPKRHMLAGQNNVSLEIVCFLSYSNLFIYLVSSVYPRHGGGDARKAHLEQSQNCEILEILCPSVDTLHYFSYQLSTSYFHHCYLFHPPSPLWMDMPKRHSLAGQNNVSLEIVCFLSCSKLFIYLVSSVHTHHGGGDARKAQVDHSRYCESLEILCLLVDTLHYSSYQLSTSYFHHCYLFHPPSPLWMDMPKRHTLASQNIVSLETVRVSDIISLSG